jgi:hypothetical protein
MDGIYLLIWVALNFVWEEGGGIIQRKLMDYLFTMEESRSITT